MTSKQVIEPENSTSPARSLVSWPLALLALTVGLLLMANSVSAWGRRGVEDLDDTKAHAEHLVGRMLNKIDASDDQAETIQRIVSETIDELAVIRQAPKGEEAGLRREIAALMTAQTIDRVAIEEMRTRHLARADLMSRILSEGLAEVMEVLTPEQRSALEERISRHGQRRRWH